MEYDFRKIEADWQQRWRDDKVYSVSEDPNKEKYYVLDMFPYPSGAGLHVGHPLGYIASDIVSRFKRLQGYNVLHPMGYDAFGLPAEQYAIQTGQHPAITTDANLKRYREQLDRVGFSFDWEREVRTCDPKYYKWTQWIFKQLFDCWYNNDTDKAERINDLVAHFEKHGCKGINNVGDPHTPFDANDWNSWSEEQQQEMLLKYRLAFLSDSWVNWCPELGTVLANDEVKDGVSERGGYPVVQKEMTQWSLRISAYAQRLLDGLDKLDWSDAIKEIQRNWIGRSEGASVRFQLDGHDEEIEVFTTRPDTIYGVTFMVLAPEHKLVDQITTDECREKVNAYVKYAGSRSERDRMTEVKNITGEFTGAHVIHPFTGEKVQVWIGDYVLAGYGTGAVMAVPSGDQRDWDFAKHFGLEIIPLLEGQDVEKDEEADPSKDKKFINSDMLNGLNSHEATPVIVKAIEEKGIGKGKINYRLRDAIFSRQRYWGEPFPVAYKGEIPYMLDDSEFHELPEVDQYLPTADGEPPLARATDWKSNNGDRMEYNTMPGWAGSSWYFLRYMDPNNEGEFVARDKADYWGQVDLYIGGAEHATGHLLYSRFWTKFLYDLGHIGFDEPFQKMINQGMILGPSNFVYRVKDTNKFVSFGLRKEYKTSRMNVDINIVQNGELDTEAFKKWRSEFADAEFILEDGKYMCGSEVEKMSKSKHNVVNPDDLCDKYGADTLRMYEMFLGPLEQFKPWDTNGITGVHNFLRKFWRLFHNDEAFDVSDDAPTDAELKTLHKTLKKVSEDIEKYQFNTGVSTFMICVNELTEMKCNKRAILEPLVVLLSPYAPHIAEELWNKLGNESSVTKADLPKHNDEYLVENSFTYPVSFNGKMRFKIELPADLSKDEVEERVLSADEAAKWLEGKTPKKVIVVPKRIVNVVI